MTSRSFPVALTLFAAAACAPAPEPEPAEAAPAVVFTESSWKAPGEADIPSDSMGASIRRGLYLLRHTPDSLPQYATANLGEVADGAVYNVPLLLLNYPRAPHFAVRMICSRGT